MDPVLAKIPKAARPETRQGAESFARFYIEQLNRAYTEPDPAALEGLDDQDCQLCQVFHSSAEKFERQGLKYESAAFRTESSVAKVFTTSSRIIELSAIQKRVNIVDKRGVVNSTTVAAKALLRFTLRFQGHWIASRIQGVS